MSLDRDKAAGSHAKAMRESGELEPIRERLQACVQPDLPNPYPRPQADQAARDALWLNDYAYCLEAENARLRAALRDVAAFMPPDYIDDTDDVWRLDGYTPEDACRVGRDDAFAIVAAIATAALESEDE